jgi:sec-independent protein translocase protein TatA
MELFGIGLPELLLILLIALIVLGPDKLPEVASQLGKAMREFQRVSKGFTEEYYKELQATTNQTRAQTTRDESPKQEPEASERQQEEHAEVENAAEADTEESVEPEGEK